MKKGCLLAVGGVVAFALIIVAIMSIVFTATSGAVAEAEAFLRLSTEGRYEESYASASQSLQANQTQSEFATKFARLGISGFESASWNKREIKNGIATLEGTVKTPDGEVVGLTMRLLKEDGAWKVVSISGSDDGATTISKARADRGELPGEEEAGRLARQSLLQLNSAMRSGDFGPFHDSISEQWQEQISAEKLKSVFQPLAAQGVDFSGVEETEPVFAMPPSRDSDGLLVLAGHFPTEPRRTVFRLTFISEGADWKLFGINAKAAANPLPLPPPEEIKSLVELTLLDFNAALQAGDFTQFHAELSTPFRRQNSPEDLQKAFQAFIDEKIDLTSIVDLEPSFSSQPTLDEENSLVVKGYYPTDPSRLHFDFRFTPEPPDWKLLVIDISLK